MTRPPLVANAADAGQQREARKKEKSVRNRQIDDLRFVLDSVEGRRVVWRLLEQCGVFRGGYVEGDRAQFRDGEQNIGQFVLGEITDARPNALIQMMDEANKDIA